MVGNEEQTNLDWIGEELKKLENNLDFGEKLPNLKMEENKVYDLIVDFSKPFDTWKDPQSNVIKKIIPVMHENVRKLFWLNVCNPLYKKLMEQAKDGVNCFKVVRIGQAKNTRFNLIK